MKRTSMAVVAVIGIVSARQALAAEVSADLQSWLASASERDKTGVIVRFVDGSQASNVPDLRIVKPYGRNLRKLGMASTLASPRSLRKLAANPNVAAIGLDRVVSVMSDRDDEATSPGAPPFSLVQLGSGSSEASRQYGTTGGGVGVAVIDSGKASHEDLPSGAGINLVPLSATNRTSSTTDRYGHGTLVAGIIAGKGTAAKRVGFNYTGVAPDASLVTVRVLDDTGSGRLSDVLAGINWVLTNKTRYKIRVVNMSFGMPAVESYKSDPLCLATKRLYDAGIVTVVSAGNFGRSAAGDVAYGSIASPGNSPWVVTVGAVNDHGTAQRSDDTVATYSSRGPSRSYDQAGHQFDHLVKPDLVASGNHVVGPEAEGNWIVSHYPTYHLDDVGGTSSRGQYMFLHGTSMAAPVVSGVVAMMLNVNPGLTPAQVRSILAYTAQTLPGSSVFDQGAGEVNGEGAVHLAYALKGASLSSTSPGTVLLSPSRMPQPTSTLSGEHVSWSRGYVLMADGRTGSSQLVQAGGVLFADGILFAEGIMVARGINTNECVLKSLGVIFAERSRLVASRVIAAGSLPRLDGQGYLDARAASFADSATLGNASLYDRSGSIVANGVLFAQGVIFAERTTTAPAALTFVRPNMLQNEPYFAQGILFAETMLPALFASTNNVLVAGEAFVYE